jgi:hypothetical protein
MHSLSKIKLLWLAFFAVLLSPAVKAQSPPGQVNIPYTRYVDQGLERAVQRINRAHQQYLNRRQALANSAEHQRQLNQLIARVARDESRSSRIMQVIRDMVRGGNRAQQNLERAIRPHLDPWLQSYSRELSNLLFQLEREYAAATEELAYHLAMYPGPVPGTSTNVPVPNLPTDYRVSLRQLGFGGAGLGISVGFDVFAITTSTLTTTIPTKLNTLLITMFGKNAAILSAGAGAAIADGPLPFGDILALGGVAWTAYDVRASSGRYRRVLRQNLHEAMDAARDEGHRQADRKALQMHRAYERALRTLANEARK